jgi:hypothetical protein
VSFQWLEALLELAGHGWEWLGMAGFRVVVFTCLTSASHPICTSQGKKPNASVPVLQSGAKDRAGPEQQQNMLWIPDRSHDIPLV